MKNSKLLPTSIWQDKEKGSKYIEKELKIIIIISSVGRSGKTLCKTREDSYIR